MSRGVGWAHRWTSKLTSWQPQRVWRPELQTFSGRPFELLQPEASRLAGLWQTTEQEQEFNLPSATRDCLEPITPGQIRSAAKRFPKSTSQTWDGFHPRHFAFLSNRVLEH
eukprot:2379844-Pyramimonas_sp.AAC.1